MVRNNDSLKLNGEGQRVEWEYRDISVITIIIGNQELLTEGIKTNSINL